MGEDRLSEDAEERLAGASAPEGSMVVFSISVLKDGRRVSSRIDRASVLGGVKKQREENIEEETASARVTVGQLLA